MLRPNTAPVGAWLVGTPHRSEEARKTAKSFAGKPCSYSPREPDFNRLGLEVYRLNRATMLFKSTARRDSSLLAALVWFAPVADCTDRSRIFTRLRSTSRAT